MMIRERAYIPAYDSLKRKSSGPLFIYLPVKGLVAKQRRIVKELNLPGIKPTSLNHFHITCVYVENCSDSTITQVLRDFRPPSKVGLEVTSVEVFEGGETPVLVWIVNPSPGLVRLQSDLYYALLDRVSGMSEFSDPRVWKPHITIAYDLPTVPAYVPTIVPFKLTADRLVVGRDEFRDIATVKLDGGIRLSKGFVEKLYPTELDDSSLYTILRGEKAVVGPMRRVLDLQDGPFSVRGGEGSGNFDHAGRPGEVGGSAEVVSGGVEVYHGTNRRHAKAILANGLSKAKSNDGYVWAATYRQLAREYAMQNADRKPYAVVVIDSTMLGDPRPPGEFEERYGEQGKRAWDQDIPPEAIIRVEIWSNEHGETEPVEILTNRAKSNSIFVPIVFDNDDYVIVPLADIVQRGGQGSGNFGHAGRPGEVGGSQAENGGNFYSKYPKVGNEIAGLRVTDEIANTSSISASLYKWEILDDVREIKFTDFKDLDKPSFYSQTERKQTEELAAAIKENGYIDPLIVVIDDKGPWVLEGGHRFDALQIAGYKSFPALLVVDREKLPDTSSVERGGEGSGNFDHAGRPGEVGGSASSNGGGKAEGGAKVYAAGFDVRDANNTYAMARRILTPVEGEGRIKDQWVSPLGEAYKVEDGHNAAAMSVIQAMRNEGEREFYEKYHTGYIEDPEELFIKLGWMRVAGRLPGGIGLEWQEDLTESQEQVVARIVINAERTNRAIDYESMRSNGNIETLKDEVLGFKSLTTRGGPGSGFHGHAGRPGEVGGSAVGDGGGGARKYDMSTWKESKPWNASKQDINRGYHPGIKYDPNMDRRITGHVYEPGVITVGPDFFEGSYEARVVLLFHEAGHGIAKDALRQPEDDYSPGIKVLEPFKIGDEPTSVRTTYDNFVGISDRPEEFLSDVYSSLMIGGRDGWETDKYLNVYDVVADTAKKLGMPSKPMFVWFNGKLTERGGPGSGHFTHDGRPGSIGGSIGGPGGPASWNEVGERASVLGPRVGQISTVKQGATREQAQRFYDRRKAVEAANRFKYMDGNSSREVIDAKLLEGPSTIRRERFYYEIANRESGQSMKFTRSEERDYIDVLMNHGRFARNYELVERGGPTSGFYGHAGRPGEVGGSAPGEGGGARESKGNGKGKNQTKEIYHGTGAKAARSIMKTGLQVGYADSNNVVDGVVFAAPSYETARDFASRSSSKSYAIITIDPSLAGSKPERGPIGGEFMFDRDIPAEAIIKVDIYGRGETRGEDRLLETIERTASGQKLFAAAAVGENEEFTLLGPTLDDMTRRHLGPGPHPSGTEQDVHSGGGGGAKEGKKGEAAGGVAAGKVESKPASEGARRLAGEMATAATAMEPALSSMMGDIATTTGGELVGLKYAVKPEESLASKIDRDAIEKGLTPEQAAAEITDVNRYTMVFDSDKYTESVLAAQQELAEKGYIQYDEKWKNYFGSGDAYDGYNSVYMHQETGERVEVQFHTPDTVGIKERAHELYERFRVTPEGSLDRLTLWEDMQSMWQDYEKPAGWESLPGNLIGVERSMPEQEPVMDYRYFVRIQSNPDRSDYRQPLSVHRFAVTENTVVTERWEGGSGVWVDNPDLLAFTGIGGSDDYREVDQAEAERFVKTASQQNRMPGQKYEVSNEDRRQQELDEAQLALYEQDRNQGRNIVAKATDSLVSALRTFAEVLTGRGGPGSGHFEHSGRTGEVGGSEPGSGGGKTDWQGRPLAADRKIVGGTLTKEEVAIFDLAGQNAMGRFFGKDVDQEALDTLKVVGLVKALPKLAQSYKQAYQMTAAGTQVRTQLERIRQRDLAQRGGPGSGHFGHAGRPGEVGGSAEGGGGGKSFLGKVKSWGVKIEGLKRPDAEEPFLMPSERGDHQLLEDRVPAILEAADRLGFPRDKIVIKMNEEKSFELAGQTLEVAGTFNPNTDMVTIYEAGLPNWGPDSESANIMTQALIAHEVQHSTFSNAIEQRNEEYEEIVSGKFEWQGVEVEPIWPSGEVKDEFKGRWPAYELLEDQRGIDRDVLQNEDGFTEYSKLWWEEWNSGVPQPRGIWTIYNESLAEVASMNAQGKLSEVPQVWQDFYTKMNEFARPG